MCSVECVNGCKRRVTEGRRYVKDISRYRRRHHHHQAPSPSYLNFATFCLVLVWSDKLSNYPHFDVPNYLFSEQCDWTIYQWDILVLVVIATVLMRNTQPPQWEQQPQYRRKKQWETFQSKSVDYSRSLPVFLEHKLETRCLGSLASEFDNKACFLTTNRYLMIV